MGGMSTQMVREFFYAVSYSAAMNLHLKVMYGENDHHKAEAMFKAFAPRVGTCQVRQNGKP
jgi:imidazoleglycerol-phosphate dehydratase